MDPVITEINDLCKTARYYRWADKKVRLGQAVWHIISMDGLEIAATALSSTVVCPTCECSIMQVGLYGEYIIPSAFQCFQSIISMLRKPEFILSTSDKCVNKYLVPNAMLEDVWTRLRDRLSSLDSSTSLLEVTSEYAAHFCDMYVEGHTGKHLTGDRIRIFLLNLLFLFRDLIAQTPQR